MEITLIFASALGYSIYAIYKFGVSKFSKIILISLIGTLLLTISAKIKIPFYPVPMTMQTFVVLFLGIVLGPKLGLLTVSLYLFEGIFGLPVFAGTPEKGVGLIYFTGPTMGYLIGFLIAAYCSGCRRKKSAGYLGRGVNRIGAGFIWFHFSMVVPTNAHYDFQPSETSPRSFSRSSARSSAAYLAVT
jgi:biotin transporter BioY